MQKDGTRNIIDKTPIAVVLGNAPSSSRWKGLKHTPLLGCNLACFDWDLTHCIVIDKITVQEILKRNYQGTTKFWTKKTPLEVPRGWNKYPAPGIDSGSLAIKMALEFYPSHKIVCVGFDGVLGGSNLNRYTYSYRGTTKSSTHQRHRKTILELDQQYPNRLIFVYDDKDQELETVSYQHAIQMVTQRNRTVFG